MSSPHEPLVPSPHEPLILIVDDNDDTTEMYAAGLTLAGFSTVQARTGLDALRQAQEVRPDIVVTDLGLLGPIDGVTLTRRLRHDERTQRIGIIVLTGRVSESDRADANGAGCDLFLTKPCLPDDLAAQISRVIASRSSVACGPHH